MQSPLFGGHGRFASLGAGLRAVGLTSHARNFVAATSIAAVGSVAYVRSWKEPPPKSPSQKLVLDRTLMEALCGGVGEVAQICVLYPLETIKVKCQSDGLATAAVMQQLLSKGGPAAFKALYAGFVSAALCSVLVGSVHYASFCWSKRLALQAMDSSSSSSSSENSQSANMLAASIGALATALVESPVELFRHQAQAGTVGGNFMQEMAKTVRTQGVGGLYWGFVPFLIESFPYDCTELGTYSQLHDWRQAALKKEDSTSRLVARVPDQAWDLAIGAAAGVASVLVSMPMDVIKTYMQTHGAGAAVAPGLGGQVAAFWQTGAKMVAVGGPGALFVGMVPRLVQQVPSTTICWWAIERCRDALEPYTKP